MAAESFDHVSEAACRLALRTRIDVLFFRKSTAPRAARFADDFDVQNAAIAQGHEPEPYLIPALHYAEILHCTEKGAI